MHTVPTFAFELLVVFAVATAVVALFHYLKQPTVAGFILSGVIVGPYGLRLISDLERVSALAEIGVILLLFSLGVEFSINKLKSMARAFFGVGLLQCTLTTFIAALALWIFIRDPIVAGVAGACASLSSTAIVLKILQERREFNTPHGKVTIAVLLFQDLWVVPMLMVLPLLKPEAGAEVNILVSIGAIVMKMALLAIAVYFLTRYVVPKVLKLVARTRMRELFFITIGLITFSAAFMTSLLGLSTALGAFVAGVMLSDSEYGHQAVADVVPLRDPFMALFFVSVGMLLDWQFFAQHVGIIAALSVAVLVGKFIITGVSGRALGFEAKVSGLVALALAQIGEFSFVVAHKAHTLQVINEHHYQYLLAVTLVLMSITPALLKFAPRVAPALEAFDLMPQVWLGSKPNVESTAAGRDELHNHVIVVGHGVNGVMLTNALTEVGIRFSLIDLNPDSIKQAQKNGISAIFGDAARREILELAGIERAHVVALCVSDSSFLASVVQSVKQARPDIHIIVRCHFFKTVEQLETVGASDVVVGELETGFEMVSRVLHQYAIAEEVIEKQIQQVQDLRYPSVRQYVRRNAAEIGAMPGWMDSFETLPVQIQADSAAIGQDIRALRLLGSGVIVAIGRPTIGLCVADDTHIVQAEDVLYLIGEVQSLDDMAKFINAPRLV